MAISKAKKETILSDVKKILGDAGMVTFVNFHGLGVSDTSKMRSDLREEGVGYRVAKKTLAKKALSEQGIKGDIPELPGELALAYTSAGSAQVGEETAPARKIYEFSKKHDGAVEIVGGIFEGAFLDKEGMLEIAQIPSLSVLRGMFVNVINSPIQRVAIALGEIAKSKA